MNQDDAVAKMRELMETMDTMEKFKNIRDKWPTAILIGFSSILASALIFLLVYYVDYLTADPYLGNLLIGNSYFGAGLFAAIAWILGIFFMYRVLNKAYTSYKPTDWSENLKEGPLGIIKIMAKYDWDQKLIDLRKSKQGYIIVTASQMGLNFFFFTILLFFSVGLFIAFVFQVSPNVYYIILFAFLFTMILGDKNLKRLHQRLWLADILIGEIGRFSSEFRQREL